MTETTATYVVQRERFRHNGQPMTVGDTLELTRRQARPLLMSGAIVAQDEGQFTPAESAEDVVAIEQRVTGKAARKAARKQAD